MSLSTVLTPLSLLDCVRSISGKSTGITCAPLGTAPAAVRNDFTLHSRKQVNLTAVPKGDQSSLRVINGVNCDVEITGNLNGWDNGAEIVPFGKVRSAA